MKHTSVIEAPQQKPVIFTINIKRNSERSTTVGSTPTNSATRSMLRRQNYGRKVGLMQTNTHDPVNHPSHYTQGKIECIDFITDKKLNFCRGNAVKYIVRAGLKDPEKEIEDLEKAVFYLNREIQDLKERKQNA